MPSVALIAPMAIIAALFPGVAARMAVGMKKWRAFLVIAGANSTLSLVYFFLAKYKLLPDARASSLEAFTLYLLGITVVGLVWAGRRYRTLAASDAAVTSPPSKVELLSLLGLTLFAAAIAASTRFFGPWSAALEVPMREFTFIAVGLLCAALYAGYRAAFPGTAGGPVHLSVSGESVGLGALFLCGFTAMLLSLSSGESRTVLQAPDSGDVKLASIDAFAFPEADQVMSGIALHGDRIYFGTSSVKLSTQAGIVFCLDRRTGTPVWKYEADDDLKPVFCTPTVADGNVYFGEGLHKDTRCRFFCLDAATGKPAWPNPVATASHTEGTPLVANGRVYFTAGDEGLHCVDARTGAKLWAEPFGGHEKQLHIDGPPALAGPRVFAGSGIYTKAVFAVDAASGKELWRRDVPFRSFGQPLALDGRIVYGLGSGNLLKDIEEYAEEAGRDPETSPGGAVLALDAATGQRLWQYDLTHSVHTPLAADALFIYAASRDGNVHCLSRKSGALRWKTPLGAPVTAGVAVAADADGIPEVVYAVSSEGGVAALDPFTGRPFWVRDLCEHTGQLVKDVVSTPAVVVEGRTRTLYVGAMTENRNTKARTATVFRFTDERK